MAKIKIDFGKKRGPVCGVVEWETPEKLDLVAGWIRNGATFAEVCAKIGIAETTLLSWRRKSDSFNRAFLVDREIADLRVENALFQKAIGGDVTAQKFWLTNRQQNKWREKQDLEVKTEVVQRPLAGLSVEEIRKLLNDQTV